MVTLPSFTDKFGLDFLGKMGDVLVAFPFLRYLLCVEGFSLCDTRGAVAFFPFLTGRGSWGFSFLGGGGGGRCCVIPLT